MWRNSAFDCFNPMSRLAHILFFLTYASASVVAAVGLPPPFPRGPTAWAAGALMFVIGVLVHEIVVRRTERLDLFEELYDLREAQEASAAELSTLRRQVSHLQTAEERHDLVAEMRLVRSQLARLAKRPARAEQQSAGAIQPAVAAGGGGVRLLDTDDLDHSEIVEIVRDALQENRVDMYLQPIVTLPQRKVRYYECLSRIRDRNDRIIEPDTYLPVCEAAGLISTIDNLLLFRCVQLVRRLKQRGSGVAFFCNISPNTLADEMFFDQFVEYLGNNPELADGLIFEFVEAELAVRNPPLHDKLRQLADLGYRFSADGVTSLNVDYTELARRDVHFIKIDAAALLGGSPTDRPSFAEVNDLRLAMAESGIHLIAGKVEQEQAVIDLLDLNVDLAQGYLFGEPRPLPEDI